MTIMSMITTMMMTVRPAEKRLVPENLKKSARESPEKKACKSRHFDNKKVHNKAHKLRHFAKKHVKHFAKKCLGNKFPSSPISCMPVTVMMMMMTKQYKIQPLVSDWPD